MSFKIPDSKKSILLNKFSKSEVPSLSSFDKYRSRELRELKTILKTYILISEELE